MVYHSLFDRIAEADPTFRRGFEQQKYQGTLDAVLDETGEALDSRTIESGIISLALHPPRIIRAIVDYKIQNPTAPEVEFLLRDAIQLGLNIYQGSPNIAKEIEELRRRITKTGNQSLLGRELKQPSDQVTWNATNPTRSRETARNLVMRTGGNPVLFVALAHGGVAAGMDTYLRYCSETGENNSTFYVARFSTQKLSDIYPQLSPTEISYLQKQLRGKRPVLFDEDMSSGKTLDRAQKFFDGSVFPQGRVIVVTNLDARGELMKLGFGKQLLEIDKYGFPDKKKHEMIKELYSNKIISKDITKRVLSRLDLCYLSKKEKRSFSKLRKTIKPCRFFVSKVIR
jgi:hypothetical protein